MIAVCALCERELEVGPLDRPEAFYDLCDPCARGVEARNPGVDDLTPQEKRGLRQAGQIALALLEAECQTGSKST